MNIDINLKQNIIINKNIDENEENIIVIIIDSISEPNPQQK